MTDEPLTVRCACGWETSGQPNEVVVATQAHGDQLHNMRATREQVLAMAAPASPEREAAAPDGGA
ncbi:MAG: hypothetical protein ABI562_02240 [Chloroflexota bacterium]